MVGQAIMPEHRRLLYVTTRMLRPYPKAPSWLPLSDSTLGTSRRIRYSVLTNELHQKQQKQEKPPRLRGLLSSLAPGKKRAPSVVSENAPLS